MYIRYAILGRNIEIVLERSRQGLLRLKLSSVPPGTGLAHCSAWLLRTVSLAAADVLAEGMAGLFKHTLQVPLRVTGALRHFFPATGRFQVILDPRQNTMIVMASLLRLTSSYLFLFLR